MKTNLTYILALLLAISNSCSSNNSEIGYRNSKIYFGQSKESVESKLEKLKEDVNGLNQESTSIQDYLLIQDQIVVNNITLNPILYFSFNDDRLIRFNASYTINNVNFQSNRIDKLIENLSIQELPGLKELIIKDTRYIQNNELLYLKSFKVDTLESSYKTINYSVVAIP